MTHDREELRLRFFEIAFADRLERHARGGVESQFRAAREAVELASAAMDAFLPDAPAPESAAPGANSKALAVAVEALRELARLGNGERTGTSLGNQIAQRALAEIGAEPVEPDYPWHLAPEGTVGAATDRDGKAFWWRGGRPWVPGTPGRNWDAIRFWAGDKYTQRIATIPDFTFPGDWRESWRWMPSKEPKP